MAYIVRSAVARKLVLATNGEFIDEDCLGPGHKLGGKIFKTYAWAAKVRNGQGIIVEEYHDSKHR